MVVDGSSFGDCSAGKLDADAMNMHIKNIKNHSKVLLTILLFLSPFIAATWCYQHAQLFKFNTTNLGHLLQTPTAVQGAWTNQAGRWQVIYWPNTATQGQKVLYELHQMRIALGKNKEQLALTLVLSAPCINNRLLQKFAYVEKLQGETARKSGVYTDVNAHPRTVSTPQSPAEVEFPQKSNALCQQQQIIKQSDINIVTASSTAFLQQFSNADQRLLAGNASGKVYLVDPQGYFFMYYDDSDDILHTLQDLQHVMGLAANG